MRCRGISIWAAAVFSALPLAGMAHPHCDAQGLIGATQRIVRQAQLPSSTVALISPDYVSLIAAPETAQHIGPDFGDVPVDIFEIDQGPMVMKAILGASLSTDLRSAQAVLENMDDTTLVVSSNGLYEFHATGGQIDPICAGSTGLFAAENGAFYRRVAVSDVDALGLYFNDAIQKLVQGIALETLRNTSLIATDVIADRQVTPKIDRDLSDKTEIVTKVVIDHQRYGRSDVSITVPRDPYETAKDLNDANSLFYQSDFQTMREHAPLTRFAELSFGVLAAPKGTDRVTFDLSGQGNKGLIYRLGLDISEGATDVARAYVGVTHRTEPQTEIVARVGQFAKGEQGVMVSAYRFGASQDRFTVLHGALLSSATCHTCQTTDLSVEHYRYVPRLDGYLGVSLSRSAVDNTQTTLAGVSMTRAFGAGYNLELDGTMNVTSPRDIGVGLRLSIPLGYGKIAPDLPYYINGIVGVENPMQNRGFDHGRSDRRSFIENTPRRVMDEWRGYMRWD